MIELYRVSCPDCGVNAKKVRQPPEQGVDSKLVPDAEQRLWQTITRRKYHFRR
jgi:hypothetical protein